MTTTTPILAQCAVCDALLAAHELTAHPAHGLICAERGGCVARLRATGGSETTPTPETPTTPAPAFLAAWEAQNARRLREREQRRALRRGRGAT